MKDVLKSEFYKEEKVEQVVVEEDFEERLMREMKEIRDNLELKKKKERKHTRQNKKKYIIQTVNI